MEQSLVVKYKFDPQVFDPNKEQLIAIKNEVANITADPTKITKEELELVNSTKNKLVKARTKISEIGKELRTDALKFQKDVIAYENSLIEIIEPEELRLKGIEKGAKEYAIRQERLKTLPEMKAKLDSIYEGIEYDDETLLAMDPTQFQAHYNLMLGIHLEKQKAEQEAKVKAENDKIAKEREDLEREKKHQEEIKAAENKARELAEQKAKQDAEDRERKIKQEEEDRKKKAAAEEQAKKDAKAKEEAELKAKTQEIAYQKFLTDNHYNKETDIVDHVTPIKTILYRRVAIYERSTKE